MTWSTRMSEGFALAATLATDRGAALAHTGLSDMADATLAITARELGSLSKAERRRRIGSLIDAHKRKRARSRDQIEPMLPLPATGLGIDAARAHRARMLLSASGPDDAQPADTRAGFLAEPGLLTCLQRLLRAKGDL